MSLLTPSTACERLLSSLRPFDPQYEHPSNSRLQASFRSVKSGLEEAARNPSASRHGIQSAMLKLAKHANWSLANNDEHTTALFFMFLPDVTRDMEFWRPLFGLQVKPTRTDNEYQMTGNHDPDCVLEVARRVVARGTNSNNAEVGLQIKGALRVIANCCADNDLNRALIVHRGGVASMMKLASEQFDAEVLVPTLFNVCNVFDEPAIDEAGRSWPAVQGADDETDSSGRVAINAAEKQLATSFDQSSGRSSSEILLDLWDRCDASRIPILADLVEMACRPAVYGVHNILGMHVDADLSTRTAILLQKVLEEGQQLVEIDMDCLTTICQAVLNLLSQPDAQTALLWLEHGFHLFISLPWQLLDEDVDEAALAPYREAFLKLTYQMSTTPEFASNHAIDSPLIQDCVAGLKHYQDQFKPWLPSRNTSSSNYPIAAICVLLSNSISTTDKAETLLRVFQFQDTLFWLLEYMADNEVLIPAINLAIKLALPAENRTPLVESGVLLVLYRFLTNTNLTLDIQRESITLIRLLVKGRIDYGVMLLPTDFAEAVNKTTFIASIMKLYQRTIDGSTKLEIGRLIVEICRTILADAQRQTQDSESAEHYMLLLTTAAGTGLADAVVFMAKEGTSAALKAEGWFGLALLSIWSSGREVLMKALQNDSMIELMKDMSRSTDIPSLENLKMLLVKLQLVPKAEIPAPLLEGLETCSRNVSMDWPKT